MGAGLRVKRQVNISDSAYIEALEAAFEWMVDQLQGLNIPVSNGPAADVIRIQVVRRYEKTGENNLPQGIEWPYEAII